MDRLFKKPDPKQDPLKGHAYYTKVKDLNKGSYGFVQVSLF